MSRHVTFLGPGECGKTTACRQVIRARGLAPLRRRAIVIDVNGAEWPRNCLVFTDRDKGLAFAWKTTGCDLVIDDATGQIYRDTAMNDLFTRVRHQHHTLFILGHVPTIMLPLQREACGTIFLFRQSQRNAALLAEEWAEPRIEELAPTLRQYEFLLCRKFGAHDGSHYIEKCKFPPP